MTKKKRKASNIALPYEDTLIEYKIPVRGIRRTLIIQTEWMKGSVMLSGRKRSADGRREIQAHLLVPHQDIRWVRNRGEHWRRIEVAIDRHEKLMEQSKS